jgi:hypothetical protein
MIEPAAGRPIRRATAVGVPLRPTQEGTPPSTARVRAFDWRRGCKFSTYATADPLAVQRASRTTHDPRARARGRAAAEARPAARRLEVELGREATKEELAEATASRIQHVDEAPGAAQRPSGLNQTVMPTTGEPATCSHREAADPLTRPRSPPPGRAAGPLDPPERERRT